MRCSRAGPPAPSERWHWGVVCRRKLTRTRFGGEDGCRQSHESFNLKYTSFPSEMLRRRRTCFSLEACLSWFSRPIGAGSEFYPWIAPRSFTATRKKDRPETEYQEMETTVIKCLPKWNRTGTLVLAAS